MPPARPVLQEAEGVGLAKMRARRKNRKDRVRKMDRELVSTEEDEKGGEGEEEGEKR